MARQNSGESERPIMKSVGLFIYIYVYIHIYMCTSQLTSHRNTRLPQ